jgi:hypothetical protein
MEVLASRGVEGEAIIVSTYAALEALQGDARQAALSVCCRHCVNGGPRGFDLEQIFSDADSGPHAGTSDGTDAPCSRAQEEARRKQKGEERVAHQRRKSAQRKRGLRP